MPERILLVDDDPGQIHILGRILAEVGELRFATSGAAACQAAQECAPDLILLDAQMPGVNGFEVCKRLKADRALADVPVIFVTSQCEPSFELAGFKFGAADFIAKPVNPPLVLARVRTQLRLKRMADELRQIATMDGLTGVANRRRFEEALPLEWLRACRTRTALSLLMIDVDHFKKYNDRYGHPAGDTCLRSIARALSSVCLRPADLVARYGGEEFVMLLPQTPRVGAAHMAAAVLGAVARLGIAHEASPTAPHVTVSVGGASCDESNACRALGFSDARLLADSKSRCGATELLQVADRALDAAKHAGRARARMLDLADDDLPRESEPVSDSCVVATS